MIPMLFQMSMNVRTFQTFVRMGESASILWVDICVAVPMAGLGLTVKMVRNLFL